MNKIKFAAIIFATFLVQLVVFVLISEYNDGLGDLFEIIPLFIAIIILLLFFWKREKIKTKYNIKNSYFYIAIIIIWTSLSVASYFALTSFCHALQCSQSIAYGLMPFFYEFEMIVILILDSVWCIIKKIKNHLKFSEAEKISLTAGVIVIALLLIYYIYTI
jgi:hypothetical protein